MKKIFSFLFITSCVILLFSSCQKDYSIENGNVQVAAGSLWDSAGVCLPDTVIGTFYDGVTPGSDTAYVEIQVNVTQTGSYSINSGIAENGLVFSDSGFFSNTGINTIRLKPIGTPILVKSSVYNISFDSSFCSFTVNVQDSTGTGLGGQEDTTGQGGDPDGGSGNWQFATDSGLFAHGTFDTVVFEQDTLFGGTDLLMAGYTPNGDSVINLLILFPGNDIAPGTYHTKIMGSDTHANALFAFGLVSTGDAIYDALSDQDVPSDISVIISSYNATTHVVAGTFSGIAANEKYDNSTIGIVNGNFTATVSP
jgi:hypothetical protein